MTTGAFSGEVIPTALCRSGKSTTFLDGMYVYKRYTTLYHDKVFRLSFQFREICRTCAGCNVWCVVNVSSSVCQFRLSGDHWSRDTFVAGLSTFVSRLESTVCYVFPVV